MSRIRFTTQGVYGTALQQRLLDMVGDDKVLRNINKIIADLVEPYVPFNSNPNEEAGDLPGGTLRRSVQVGPKEIRWTTPYAHYVYEGIGYGPNYWTHLYDNVWGWRSPAGQMKYPNGKLLSYSTPGTGSHWDELMLSQQRGTMNRRITSYLKQECKRRGL